jgi:hypothetical protein
LFYFEQLFARKDLPRLENRVGCEGIEPRPGDVDSYVLALSLIRFASDGGKKGEKMRARLLLMCVLLLGLNVFTVGSSAEPRFSECLLPRASMSLLSLGAPLATERLGNRSKVRIGVLPFIFKESRKSNLSEEERRDFVLAAKILEDLSNGNVKIELAFYPTVISNLTYERAGQMYLDRNDGWQNWDLNKSTFGIVKETVKAADSVIDFSRLDLLILFNKSEGIYGGIGEAFSFFRTPPELKTIKEGIGAGKDFNFHQSIQTQEGYIDNAVLLDRRFGTRVIAHEILHTFGLTDLYGSNTPFSIHYLSIMAGEPLTLLNLERAVLGWFPVEQIQCFKLGDLVSTPISKATISFENFDRDQLVIIRVSDQEAYVIEVLPYADKRLMILYRLRMEERPPIELFSALNGSYGWNINATTFSANDVSKVFTTPDFQLLFSNLVGRTATFHFVSKAAYNSDTYSELLKSATENQTRALASESSKKEAEAKAKAEAEAEAKIAADKTASELKAKQEAEAKAKAEALKKVTITCVKGKLIKKVTAVNPKCPAGYVKK